jgi:hypothetical protein
MLLLSSEQFDFVVRLSINYFHLEFACVIGTRSHATMTLLSSDIDLGSRPRS